MTPERGVRCTACGHPGRTKRPAPGVCARCGAPRAYGRERWRVPAAAIERVVEDAAEAWGLTPAAALQAPCTQWLLREIVGLASWRLSVLVGVDVARGHNLVGRALALREPRTLAVLEAFFRTARDRALDGIATEPDPPCALAEVWAADADRHGRRRRWLDVHA